MLVYTSIPCKEVVIINFKNIENLKKSTAIPLYYQLEKIITKMIEEGKLNPGDKLPSERKLADDFLISRMTVRQALNELVNKGKLVRKSGLGTFVAKPKLQYGLFKLTSFTEDMKKRGLKASSKILSLEKIKPFEMVKNKLEAGDSYVYRLERLRFADDEPMALEISHLKVDICPSLNRKKLKDQSLYQILADEFKIIMNHAEETMEGGLATAREAERLNIQVGDSVLLRERLTYDQNDNPVEFVKSIYRSDRYKFYISLNKDV